MIHSKDLALSVVRQLYVNDAVLVVCMCWGCLVVAIHGPRGVLEVSRLAGL